MAVNVEKHIQHWLQGAGEAWEDADALLEKKRYAFAAFAAHLALEKTLKAHVTRVSKDIPPRTHDLKRLGELAGLSLSPEQVEFLGEFNKYQLESRYRELDAPMSKPESVLESIRGAKRLCEWLKQQL
ncbi:MAG: HEPN domain-containing protein [Candidatus Hydrogenedentes bacterium]|nr:HEPN domain-containing protein [Candidatus Hydrogenedentota bacterium]